MSTAAWNTAVECGMQRQSISAVDDFGRGLQVEFVWKSDRFGHVISLLDPQREPCAVWESIEGTPAEPWPTSPPFQSLTIQEVSAGRTAALLVGMAGANHWSASVE